MAAAAAIAACAGRAAKQLTLVLVHCNQRVLLGMKKRGFGMGKFNGFGGKIEPGETILEAAVREVEEEACIRVDAEGAGGGACVAAGHLVFEFEGVEELLHVHVFRATGYAGEPRETEEMAPQWFPEDALPYDRMWLDDKYWLPILLAGRKFNGYFLFRGHDTLVRYDLEEVDALAHDAATAKLVAKPQGAIVA